jgi:hypothetical protein
MALLSTLALAATLAVPGHTNANVSLAGDGAFVVAVWSASQSTGTDIYAAISRDSGRTFSAPVRVNAPGGTASVNGEQPPRVVLAPQRGGTPAIVVVWTAKGSAGTTLLTARSTDEGRSFTAPALVPGTDASGNRGWQSAAVDTRGTVRVLWLDHREMAQPSAATTGHAGHAGHDATASGKRDGAAMAQLSKLYIAPIGEGALPRAITGGVCYCCKTAIAAGADGSIFAAWRHVYAGNIRDIAFTASRDGGKSFQQPVRVSEDKWVLDGCPDDGPAMAVDASGRIHVVWPTLVADAGGEPTIGIFYATSRDGRTFTPRERVPVEGAAHHPQIAIAHDGTVALAWDEATPSGRRVAFARARDSASGVATFERFGAKASGVYPVLTPTSRGLVAAWTERTDSTSVIRLLPIDD